ncbi:osteoclast-associated immunoglobulin-like receptor isoform X1 [Cricetulus griseus]|uniref:osteoclast-associated immunoglobulin-like receptor isoform X1 n=1 Tax=Cricetulus griseus TaxID=10029 RepID=UPI00022F5FF0|nr:osteoclast-associated immunoglobulin-like receptor isoform X1 [Cricetulus griseus]
MILWLTIQLLTLWPACHTDITLTAPPASSPQPWLGAHPAAVVTPGVNVTLRCRAPQPAWRFALFRTGVLTPLRCRDVSAELAEFFLEEVTLAQGGSYYCRYRRTDWERGVWSQSSNVLELLVTGEVPGGMGEGPRSEIKHTPSAPYVLSQRSQPLVISSEGPGSSDYTQANLIRLGLAGLVLICLGVLVTFDWHSRSSAFGRLLPQQNWV